MRSAPAPAPAPALAPNARPAGGVAHSGQRENVNPRCDGNLPPPVTDQRGSSTVAPPGVTRRSNPSRFAVEEGETGIAVEPTEHHGAVAAAASTRSRPTSRWRGRSCFRLPCTAASQVVFWDPGGHHRGEGLVCPAEATRPEETRVTTSSSHEADHRLKSGGVSPTRGSDRRPRRPPGRRCRRRCTPSPGRPHRRSSPRSRRAGAGGNPSPSRR